MKRLLKWGGIAFAVLIVLGIIGSIMGGDSTDTSSTSSSSKEKSVAKTETTEKKDTSVKIGEEITVGEVKWIVNKAERLSEVKPDNEYGTVAKPNGTFVMVDMTAELVGKESGTIDSSQLKVVDSQGRKFEPTDNFDVSVNLGDAWIFLKQVNPNVPLSGKAVFDIANDAQGLKLEIHDLRFGSNDKGYVDLGI